MGWVESQSVRFILPAFADEFVGGECGEGFESFGEVVGGDEVVEVRFSLIVAVVVVAFDGSFFDGSVPAFDLSVSPGVVGFGEAMVDAMAIAGAAGWMATLSGREPSMVLRQVGELNAVVGQHGVDAIRNRRN